MKRINIILSDELAFKVVRLSKRKELSVAEIARRSLEIYLQRFPELRYSSTPFPVYDFGKIQVRDLKKAVYDQRIRELLRRFYTRNDKHFRDYRFLEVINPL